MRDHARAFYLDCACPEEGKAGKRTNKPMALLLRCDLMPRGSYPRSFSWLSLLRGAKAAGVSTWRVAWLSLVTLSRLAWLYLKGSFPRDRPEYWPGTLSQMHSASVTVKKASRRDHTRAVTEYSAERVRVLGRWRRSLTTTVRGHRLQSLRVPL